MVLGKLPVPGRPTIWITVGQGPTALAVGAGGGCLDIFTLIYPFSPLSPSLWETARYRLKYCLKGPLNPKQPTNQNGSQTLTQKFLFADIENEGILGMDFLTAHQCDLMLTQNCMKIKREKIRCFANSRNAQPTCCRVAVSENFTIPPETEMLVEGFTTNVIDRHSTGLIEVDTKFLHKKGLLVAKALVCPSN